MFVFCWKQCLTVIYLLYLTITTWHFFVRLKKISKFIPGQNLYYWHQKCTFFLLKNLMYECFLVKCIFTSQSSFLYFKPAGLFDPTASYCDQGSFGIAWSLAATNGVLGIFSHQDFFTCSHGDYIFCRCSAAARVNYNLNVQPVY